MNRKSVVGTRSSLLWLLILILLALLAGLALAGLIFLPQLRATRDEQARLAEAERHYQAGVAFQNVEDWSAAAEEYRQVILRDAGYKDVQERLTAVRSRLKEIAATATAEALAQAKRAQADATATAQAAATATQQALEVHYQKGVAFMNLGRWDEALTELEQVFQVNPNYKDVQARLAQITTERAKAVPTATPTPRFAIVEVAGGKPATASGYWKGAASNHIFPPENVTDRKTDESKESCDPGAHTYWLLPDRSRGWVQVDLLQSYSIVKLRWLNTHNGTCGDRATTSVTGRYEGEEHTVHNGSMSFSRTPTFEEIVLSAPVTARFVRFYVNDYYNWGGGLNEVEVYAQVSER